MKIAAATEFVVTKNADEKYLTCLSTLILLDVCKLPCSYRQCNGKKMDACSCIALVQPYDLDQFLLNFVE